MRAGKADGETWLRLNEATRLLGVSPNTLRSWERRYGFPTPKRTVGNHRNYDLIELQTLRDALAQTGNISSAVALARQRQEAAAKLDAWAVQALADWTEARMVAAFRPKGPRNAEQGEI